MSVEIKSQLSNAHEQAVNAASAPAGSTPEAEVTPTVASFRKEKTRSAKFSWGWRRESTGR
jgi:hypothetical protein